MPRHHLVSAVLAAALLVLVLPPCARAGQSAPAHGGHSPKRGDGYYKPIAQNSAWKMYKFNVLIKLKETSLRYAPPPLPQNDPNQPGSIASITSEIFNADGKQIGIGSWNRLVVANDPLDGGDEGDVSMRRLLVVCFEFGSEADGYFDDALTVTIVAKRRLDAGPGDWIDYDAVINGGAGRFLGATGRVQVSDAVFGETQLKSGVFEFLFYVPNNFPIPR